MISKMLTSTDDIKAHRQQHLLIYQWLQQPARKRLSSHRQQRVVSSQIFLCNKIVLRTPPTLQTHPQSSCSFNSDSGKSIVECYCESFGYGMCVNYGVGRTDLCEAMHCCYEQSEDDARLDCFTTRFKHWSTGSGFHNARDTIQESCVASGRSSDQCKCDIHGLSNCVYGIDYYTREPRCDLFQCCQSQTGDNDEGRKDCLVQDEAQLMYETCINYGNTTESCVCDKSNTLCSSGHTNDRHCKLTSCCQEQADDIGRKECIGNFTTNQPSFAPSRESIPQPDTSPASSPSTVSVSIFGCSARVMPLQLVVSLCIYICIDLANKQYQGDQVLEGSTVGTPNNSDSNLLGPKKLRKSLVVTAVISWILLT